MEYEERKDRGLIKAYNKFNDKTDSRKNMKKKVNRKNKR